MSHNPLHDLQLTRRSALGLGLGGLAAVALAACTPGGVSSQAARSELLLPTFRAQRAADATAIVSKVAGVQPVYTAYPASYWTSVAAAPGRGGELKTFQMLYFSPPAALESNPFWQELNKRINADFKPSYASGDNYDAKVATTLAGGTLPDIMYLRDEVPAVQQAIQAGAFADLSDALGGDAVLEYPNLANLETHAWRNSAKSNRIMGVPRTSPRMTSCPVIRTDLMEAVGATGQPADAAAFADVLAEIAKLGEHAGRRVWAVGGLGTGQIQMLTRWMFGAGADWTLSSGGKLVHSIETDAFEASMEYLADLWQRKVFHPDAIALGSDSQRSKEKQLWLEGSIAFELDDPSWLSSQGMLQVEEGTPGARVGYLMPPGHDGGEIVVQAGPGYGGFDGISASAAKDPKRLAELLRFLDWWAAPFGTEENLFIGGSGLEGYNYTFGPNKQIVSTDDATALANLQGLKWLGVTAPPYIVLNNENAPRADSLVAQMEYLTTAAVDSPVVGLTSTTQTSRGAQLTQINDDYRNKIVSGKLSVSAIKDWRADWRKAGGDQVKADYRKLLDERG
ncbi:extracellular solute-binding protein [Plantibacter sp. PA-3-X8]|uniref:extracellular solute-binding protein n=1 Tax=Plantibacter sp. PA-3-X8 TaxID=2480625 RepID=UPI000F5EB846|nr:extracellular solute-binding protein [Plantibacter sp. PA-3-X8]AZH82567.1 extracellular solute-binding protein [Plantibacter sp. PA-3-X8]